MSGKCAPTEANTYHLDTGIFMGLMASFLFVSILYVGFSALSSLEVPYAAFEKDISAGAQKKQQ